MLRGGGHSGRSRRCRRRARRGDQPRREPRGGRAFLSTRSARRVGAPRSHDRLRRRPRRGGDRRGVADPAFRKPRARPLHRAECGARARQAPAHRPADLSGVDHVSRHDARGGAAYSRRERDGGRQGLLPRLLARAHRPRPGGLDGEDDTEGRRRRHARLHRARRHLLRARDRHRLQRLLSGSGRANEAPREHLPLGQHRARQRACAALRPDARRRLGGRRGGRDEALRIHELQAGARPRRALPPRGSLLPRLESARVRLLHGVHRARGQGQREHALLLPGEDRPRAELGGESGQGEPRPPRRRRLQGRCRRPARVAGAEADRAPARRGGQGLLPRSARGRAPGPRTHVRRPRRLRRRRPTASRS